MHTTQHHSLRHEQSGYRQATYWLGVIGIGLTVGLGVQFTHAAFTPPTDLPPVQSVSGPLTTGAADQTKTGKLSLGNGLEVSNGGGAFSFIRMASSGSQTGGAKYIHASGDDIGFLNGAGNTWLTHWNDKGDQFTKGNAEFGANVVAYGNLYGANMIVGVGNNTSILTGDGNNTSVRQEGTLWVTNKRGDRTADLAAQSITAYGDVRANNILTTGNVKAQNDVIAVGNFQSEEGSLNLVNSNSRIDGDGWNVGVRAGGALYVQHPDGGLGNIGSDGLKGADHVYVNDVWLQAAKNGNGEWASKVAGPQITREANESGQVGAVVAATTATCKDGAVAVGGGGWCEIQTNFEGAAGLLIGSRPIGNTQWQADCGATKGGYLMNAHAYVICAKS